MAEAKRAELPETEWLAGDPRPAKPVEVGAPRSKPLSQLAPIGPFRLLELLGEGGMGQVYLAEQAEPVHRRVALKVVREALRGPQALARFNAEQQALARLSHPAIAQLLEAGTTDDGFPFFAMEWVDGAPITEFCRDQALALDDRLRLMVEVCRGVEHAHQRQVLHRDLKPSNILVAELDGRQVPKVIDFGIAKGLDQPLGSVTMATGQHLLGTPEYMSPEALGLVEGGVDTRSDVYALGIVLYELVTGERPFSPTHSLGDLLRERLGRSTPRPSTRIASESGSRPGKPFRKVAGDLDWIVLKAIASDREQRYGSAAALAEDLTRFLADEPVSARPPSSLYLLRKLVRRHRATTVAAVVATLALIGATVGTSLALVRARRAEGRATHEAESSRRVASFLTDLFQGADPTGFRGGNVSARDLLKAGADRLATALGDEPLVRARLLGTVGEIHKKLGLFDEAQGLLEESARLSEAGLSAADPELARALSRLGGLEAGRGRFEKAEPLLRRALSILEAANPPLLAEIAAAESELGVVAFSQGRAQDAAPHFARAITAAESSLPVTDPLLAKAVGNLAATRQRLGDLEGALALATRALALEESSGRGETSGLGYRLVNLGAILGSLGRVPESLENYRRALTTLSHTLGEEHPTTLATLMNLGVSHRKLGNAEEAERCFRAAVAGFKAKLGSEHPQTADGLFKLGLLLWDQGRLAEAEAIYRERAVVFRRLGEARSLDLLEELSFIGTLALAQGRTEEAETLLREPVADSAALPITQQPYGLAFAYWSLGNLCRDSGRASEAESHYRRALELVDRCEQDPSRAQHHVPQRSAVEADLAGLLRRVGRAAEAAAWR